MKTKGIPEKYRIWVEARKKFRLSHAQIQMARELGMNPKKFGSLANNDQEPWKGPLGEFIEELYEKHFRKTAPDVVRSIEEMVKAQSMKKEQQKTRKLAKTAEAGAEAQNEERAGCEQQRAPRLATDLVASLRSNNVRGAMEIA
jgi:hypothetical protein